MKTFRVAPSGRFPGVRLVCSNLMDVPATRTARSARRHCVAENVLTESNDEQRESLGTSGRE